ncbi:hypothetical protein TI05_15730 [Achromatium sp. WMS3]|nr:hypothetical protein TI05_15730 [Achromatium sp. WMS3]
MEYGLCCLFWEEPIKFKTYTNKDITKLHKEDKNKSWKKVIGIWQHNIQTLQSAIDYCRNNNIKSYRISSDLLPQLHKMITDEIISQQDLDWATDELKKINSDGIILSMHPGQHVNMGSPSEEVISNSVRDLRSHFFVAIPLGCTEINIHLGGAYGDKEATIARLKNNMRTHFTPEELSWITFENDELNYSLKETVAVCKDLGIRCTYDLHHQRCHELKYDSDGTEEEYFQWAKETWDGYDYMRMHISTPKAGYTTISKSRPHHDFIDLNDLPRWLLNKDFLHVDIEAKAKETAIRQLKASVSGL